MDAGNELSERFVEAGRCCGELGRARAEVVAGTIDIFDRSFLRWITLGGMDLKLSASGNPLGMRALQAKYQQAEGQFSLLLRPLSNLARRVSKSIWLRSI